QHIIARRASRSEMIVIDPHASPQKWAVGNVVGLGRDYERIDRALDALVRLMIKRYGENGYEFTDAIKTTLFSLQKPQGWLQSSQWWRPV
ncbi:MAG TPA: hypothetical protein PKD98_06150, partial [Anaerolineae bacterium]|nr:hypothetical protein [Anaerolineae bacterium]